MNRFLTSCSRKKLNELGFVGRGRSKHRPRNHPILYGGKYPFFQTLDIKNAILYLRKYSQTYNEIGLAQSKLWKPGTLMITIAGANTAETAILGIEGCFPDSVVGFIADPSKADVRFVKYYIDYFKMQMQDISRGTTQHNLSLSKLLAFDFLVPEVQDQEKIAGILSQHDDLVELNLRQIELLEDFAESIYNKWFERFKFPGHEKTKFIESTLGRIPDGWEIVHLKEFVDFERGVEPGSENYFDRSQDGRLPFLRVGDFGDRKSEIFIEKELSNGKVLKKDDIALTLDGTAGIVRIGLEGCYSTGIRKAVIKNKSRLTPGFLYFLLKSDRIQSVIKAHARGTTILHAGSSVDYLTFVLPPAPMMKRFSEIVEPVLQYERNLLDQNSTLSQLRNLLLPHLIFGKIKTGNLVVSL